MADGHRKYPVDHLILHHSMGPEFENAQDIEVQDWFDRIGKGRGYKDRTRSYHLHPSRDKETFAQAQYALIKKTTDGNKYGWRLVLLMKDPWNNVAWHAGDWPMNQRSIGIEVCGDYQNKILPEKACMCIADAFRDHDRAIGGVFQIRGHKQVSIKATACPGRIMENRETIIDMINNPDSWNEKLWPKPRVIDWKVSMLDVGDELYMIKEGAILENFTTGEEVKDMSGKILVDAIYTNEKGDKWGMTTYSKDKQIPNGIRMDMLEKIVIVEAPKDEPPTVEEEKNDPEKPSEEEIKEDPTLKPDNWLVAIIKAILSLFKK